VGNVDFGPGVQGVIAIGCAPFSAILGVGFGVCVALRDAAFEIALPLVKDQVINPSCPRQAARSRHTGAVRPPPRRLL